MMVYKVVPGQEPVVIDAEALVNTALLAHDETQDDRHPRKHYGTTEEEIKAEFRPPTLLDDATGAVASSDYKSKMPKPWFGYLMAVGCLVGFATSVGLAGGFAPVDVNPMLGPPPAGLVSAGAKVTSLILDQGEWWRLVTPLWLHAGVIHLATNLNMLYRMGLPLERGIGTVRFALLYLTSGVFSMVYSAVFSPQSVTVGASGALFGVFGVMLGELCQNCHLLTARERICGFTTLLLSIVINLAVGLLPFVDNFAHLGGCVSGLLLGSSFILYRDRRGGLKFRQVVFAVFAAIIWFVLALFGVVLLYFKIDANSFCPWCKYISCAPSPWWSC